MRIALFYPDSIYSAWSLSRGLLDELGRMGHEVIDCGMKPDLPLPHLSDRYPSFDELNGVDRIIVSGPEHLRGFITALYPTWDEIKPKVVGWLHETMSREDYGTLPVDAIKRFCPILFTPAHQDQQYGFPWLPFGVDTAVFHGEVNFPREHGTTFIGLMYAKRLDWLRRWGIVPRIVRAEVKGPDGVLPRETVHCYASELRQSRVLLNLPTLCDHLVTKVFEAMACGCAVVTPINLNTVGAENYSLFQNNVHLFYYEDDPRDLPGPGRG